MPTSVNIREIILFGTSLFLAFFMLKGGCKNQQQKNDLLRRAIMYEDSTEFYKLMVNDKLVDVAFNQSLVLENTTQLKAVIAKNDTLLKLLSKFKNIASTTIIKERVIIQRDTISIEKQIPCDFKPFKVRRDSMYYHFAGTIAPTFFSIDSLVIPNKQSIVMGDKKLGFLKGTEKRVEIINSNPLIKTDGIKSYVVVKPKKWYQTTAFKVGAGALAGSIGYWQLTK